MTPHSQRRIGGWLILLAIALVLFAIRTAIYLIALVPAIRIAPPGALGAVGTFGVFYELVGNGLLFVGAVLLLVLFFMRRRVFTLAALAFLAVFVGFAVGDLLLGLSVPKIAARPTFPWRSTVFVAVGAAVAVWYLTTSERVRDTFTR